MSIKGLNIYSFRVKCKSMMRADGTSTTIKEHRSVVAEEESFARDWVSKFYQGAGNRDVVIHRTSVCPLDALIQSESLENLVS